VLTDKATNLKLIANGMLDEGLKGRKIYVCENLSLDKERIRMFDVSSVQKVRVSELNVIIILNDE
jgi:precorrin-6B methylase 1